MDLVILLALLSVVAADDKHVTMFDNIDIDAILRNQYLLNGYVNCMLDRGRCSPQAAKLKGTLPDAIKTDCEKCSEKQKESIYNMLKFLYNKKKDIYKELEAKYDPERKYQGKYLLNSDD